MESMVYRKKSPLFVLLIPTFAFLLVFLFLPFIVNIIATFFKIGNLGFLADPSRWEWAGWAQYERLFADSLMGEALVNTLILMAGAILFQVGIALVLAIMVDSIKAGAKIYRTVYFFPIVVAGVAIGLFFSALYFRGDQFITKDDAGNLTSSTGGINQILFALNPNMDKPFWFFDKVNFLTGSGSTGISRGFIFMILPIIWQYVGFYFVIILTGLNNISDDIYEAASIDGAVGFKKVRYITLPLLFNVLTTCLTLAITGTLKVYDLAAAVNLSPQFNRSYLLGTYMFDKSFGAGNVAYASLIGLVVVVLGVVVSQACNIVLKPKDY